MTPSGDSRPQSCDRLRTAEADYRRHLAEMPPAVAAILPPTLGAPSPDEVTLSDGRVLTAADLFDALREMVSGSSDRVDVAVRPGVGLTVVFAIAWRCVLYQQVRALLVLTDAGLQDAGLLNARVALEHGALLARLRAAAVDGTDREFLERQRATANQEEQRTLNILSKIAHTAGEPSAALVDEAAGVLAGNRSTAARADSPLAAFPALKVVYRQLSDVAHAGLGSAGRYLLDYVRSGRLGGQPAAGRWAEAFAYLVWAIWCADATVDFFLIDGATAGCHQPVLDRLGLPFAF